MKTRVHKCSSRKKRISIPIPKRYDYEKEALREELDMIRSELATLKEEKEEEIDHLELLEKSYRMAAKYFASPSKPLLATI